MKAQKDFQNNRKTTGRRIIRHHRREKDQDQVNDMLKLCLQKICELQAEMEMEEDDQHHDAEAEGYAACAVEALRFLSSQGLPPDHPMVKALSEKLLRNRD
ncbi:uncharacterized protein LOC126738591 [Anthonomus grandis grandis]|uniref:uncharacterized protein LOC126738591 n=1 Tax=Anthonomus grandis grandis TaxID=2921223 RepID=UPI0021661257|nr:uncharacterized protein LOC126738591 [Anthonomus grandis grandis]